ncbi:superinfection immunity protein [Novosphingobium pokkalii]
MPSFVAYKRGRHNRSAILLLNLFLGWTFFGWVIALVWSTTTPSAPTMAYGGRMGLGELAARTAVRATVWETVFRLFR